MGTPNKVPLGLGNLHLGFRVRVDGSLAPMRSLWDSAGVITGWIRDMNELGNKPQTHGLLWSEVIPKWPLCNPTILI